LGSFVFGVCLMFPNSTHIHKNGRADHQTGHAELAADWQFSSREGMLEGTHGGFHRGSQIVFVLVLGQVILASLRNAKFLKREVNEVPWIAQLRSGTAALVELERAGGASLGGKACKPA
jgi:hypothetical protein